MDFDGDSTRKVDAVARARAARQQRERVSSTLSEQHRAAVASKLQVSARRFLTVLRSRALLRAEWRCPPSPSNGQQLVICLWLLRFFDPLHDGVALCTLCRAVVAGMEQEEPALMFAAAGLRREFALRWVDTLRRLLLACARLLDARDEPVQKQALAAGMGGPSKQLSGQLNGRFGPVLRLLLLAVEPAAWRLVHKLSASPAGQPAAGALTLMAQAALQGAMASVVASCSGFVLAMHMQVHMHQPICTCTLCRPLRAHVRAAAPCRRYRRSSTHAVRMRCACGLSIDAVRVQCMHVWRVVCMCLL